MMRPPSTKEGTMFKNFKNLVVNRFKRNGKVLTKPEQYTPYYNVK